MPRIFSRQLVLSLTASFGRCSPRDDAEEWLKNHDAEEWVKNHDAEEWLKNLDAEEWVKNLDAEEWSKDQGRLPP